MKNRVIFVILSFLIIIIISFLIIFNIYLGNINEISKTIDDDIIVAENNNTNLKIKLEELKEKNKIQDENLKNMNDYINSLNEKVKAYE